MSTSITKNVSEEAVSAAKLMAMLLVFNHLIVYLNLHVWLWPSNDLLISLHRTEEVHNHFTALANACHPNWIRVIRHWLLKIIE